MANDSPDYSAYVRTGQPWDIIHQTPVFDPDDPTAEYLGDGVYVSHDGYQVWVWTRRDSQGWVGIALDRLIYRKFKDYADPLYAEGS